MTNDQFISIIQHITKQCLEDFFKAQTTKSPASRRGFCKIAAFVIY